MSVVSNIKKILSNLPGWKTRRRLVVIESDDWGSVRMPSHEGYLSLKSKGVDLDSGDSFRYNNNDTLANAADLTALFETLQKHKDKNGRPAAFTAVSMVANPDFEKIRQSDFQQYHYEPFTETLRRYPGREGVFALWQQGIREKLFIPQFHGREHLNVAAWMKALRENDKPTRLAFDQQVWGFNNVHPYGVSYQAAFDLTEASEVEEQKLIIKDGLQLFEKLFGYKATFFVPPNGPFNNTLEAAAASGGVKYMSCSKIQQEPLGEGKTRRVLHYLGQKNKHGQRYITRNCFFEPGQAGKDWVASCMRDIEQAFQWNKPAVVSSHRVNYIGAIHVKNRENGLRMLDELLGKILKTWPDTEFITSDQLGDLMNQSK